MLSKILAIAWKSLYTTYSDRNQLLVMLATPLALATLIGFAFSSFFSPGKDVPITQIKLAVVNLDTGASINNNEVKNGQIIVDMLVPVDGVEDPENALHQLTSAVLFDDADTARRAVDEGTYAAALIIPADFSSALTYRPGDTVMGQTQLEVYGSAASPVSVNIVRSIAQSFANVIATGNITINATIEELIAQTISDPVLATRLLAAQADGSFAPAFELAFDPMNNPIRLEQQSVRGEPVSFNPLAYFGAANAIFFMMFTAQGGAASLHTERAEGTLQRMLVTPTPRLVILLGKLVGTFINCVVQLLLLFVFLTLVGSLFSGELRFVWGSNFLAVIAVAAATALAASGLGALLTALVKDEQQGDTMGSVVVMAMGVIGGTFFDTSAVPVLSTLRYLTINFWGTSAFTRLSANDGDIGLNVLILTLLGVVMFVLGLLLFNRRLEI